eukprot:CAMPEP_0119059652 /NCGR_PEP_ID=MMETSP1178-20130426/3738_1 /TAXON_ID=33656 /ORGANISM="unid sp, Strain CCMP2000" /LENGTH=77 /DNA_ID=CAMNT_0007040697 /DNA_START=580 /DNA_END=813 /DNA_ORIENTATION=-
MTSRRHNEKPELPTQCSRLLHHAGSIPSAYAPHGAPTKAKRANRCSGTCGCGHITVSGSKSSSIGAAKVLQNSSVFW